MIVNPPLYILMTPVQWGGDLNLELVNTGRGWGRPTIDLLNAA